VVLEGEDTGVDDVDVKLLPQLLSLPTIDKGGEPALLVEADDAEEVGDESTDASGEEDLRANNRFRC
jgi:hypothetical protein